MPNQIGKQVDSSPWGKGCRRRGEPRRGEGAAGTGRDGAWREGTGGNEYWVIQRVQHWGSGWRHGQAKPSNAPTSHAVLLLPHGHRTDCSARRLQAIGVKPETTLAKAAGLELGGRGGIKTDAHMRTSDPAIFAVGDAVEVGVRARCSAVAQVRGCARDAVCHCLQLVVQNDVDIRSPRPLAQTVPRQLSPRLQLRVMHPPDRTHTHTLCFSLCSLTHTHTHTRLGGLRAFRFVF